MTQMERTNEMNMPGFTAQATLFELTGHNRIVPALAPGGVRPGQECIQECLAECMESEDPSRCGGQCREKCRSHIPPYQCTMHDNSANHYASLAGKWAWEKACNAECSLLEFGSELCKQLICKPVVDSWDVPPMEVCY
jgi:hypothetical protein